MAEEKKIVFLNRDLSWLSFNHRVLQEAADRSVPLYNRIAFLAIFSSNLDEFFRVRMPSIFAFTSIEAKKTTLREEYPKELVQIVQNMVLEEQEEFGSILREQILPELQQNHICLYYNQPIRAEHTETIGDALSSSVYDRFGYPGLFAAYNAGPARYAEHVRTGRALPGESRAYLASVAGVPVNSRSAVTAASATPRTVNAPSSSRSATGPLPAGAKPVRPRCSSRCDRRRPRRTRQTAHRASRSGLHAESCFCYVPSLWS